MYQPPRSIQYTDADLTVDLIESVLKEVAIKANAHINFSHIFSASTFSNGIGYGFVAWFEIGSTYRNVLYRDGALLINDHKFNMADPGIIESIAKTLKICASHGQEICNGCKYV